MLNSFTVPPESDPGWEVGSVHALQIKEGGHTIHEPRDYRVISKSIYGDGKVEYFVQSVEPPLWLIESEGKTRPATDHDRLAIIEARVRNTICETYSSRGMSVEGRITLKDFEELLRIARAGVAAERGFELIAGHA